MAFRQPDHTRTLVPILAALAVAVVVLIVIFTIGVSGSADSTATQGTTVAADKALACPRTYEQTSEDTDGWVPLRPHEINGDDALVPDETPTHAVVCSYLSGVEPDVTKTVALTGRSVLAGSLTGLEHTLSAAPRLSSSNRTACAAVLTQADTRDYLFGLRYGSAVVWVSAPGYHCAGSTNGSFITRRNVSSYAAASYAAQRWVG